MPALKSPFSFVTSKLQIKMQEFRKMVYLKGEIYNRNVTTTALQTALTTNVVVSHSGRTLAQILSLSHPEDLSRYTIDGVVPGYGREGTVVHYSRPESNISELQRTQQEHEKEIGGLKKKVLELEKTVLGLKQCMAINTEVLAEWQVASLVICAFGSYAWKLVSTVNQTQLAQYGIYAFWDIYHTRLRRGNARTIAERIYQMIDVNIRVYAERLMGMKGNVSVDRRNLAHPVIQDDKLLEFLIRLGSDEEELEPGQVALFEFLKLSNRAENVALAARGG